VFKILFGTKYIVIVLSAVVTVEVSGNHGKSRGGEIVVDSHIPPLLSLRQLAIQYPVFLGLWCLSLSSEIQDADHKTNENKKSIFRIL